MSVDPLACRAGRFPLLAAVLMVPCDDACCASGGLLSNIRVDARTRISIRATSILLTCWQQVWRALRTGTWTALVMLHIPTLHVTVAIIPGSTQSPSELKGDDQSAKQTLISEVEISELSLKDFRHPVWRQLRERIRVVRAMCRMLSVLAVSVGSISVNVVGEADEVTHEIFRLEVRHARMIAVKV